MVTVNYHKLPGEYQCIKVPINKVTNEEVNKTFEQVVHRVNQLNIKTYMFIKHFYLHCYHNQQPLPFIDKDFISVVRRVLIIASKDRQPIKGTKLHMFDNLSRFYDEVYSQIDQTPKINGRNLHTIIPHEDTKIITAIENNIRNNYITCVYRFVNCSFQSTNQYFKNKDHCLFQQQLKSQLYKVKQDLINNTKTSDPQYHQWIDTYRSRLLPNNGHFDFVKSSSRHDLITCDQGHLQYIRKADRLPTFKAKVDALSFADLQTNPQRYLPCMLFMALEMEKMGAKLFRWFPLRTNCVPKYIPIDTTALIELFITDGRKTEMKNHVRQYRDEVWGKVFNFDCKAFHSSQKYVFDYFIETNGHTVSVRKLRKDLVDKNEAKKDNRLKKRNQQLALNKNLTDEQVQQDKKEKAQRIKQEQKQRLEAYKNLSKEEKKELSEKSQTIENILYVPHMYFNQLPEAMLDRFKDRVVVYIDPGKRSLLTMMAVIDEQPIYLTYSYRQRMKEVKTFKYRHLLHNHRELMGILEHERQFQINAKTARLNVNTEYIKGKTELNNKVGELYQDTKFRQYQFYHYINDCRSKDNLLNSIEKVYGKNPIIVFGNWSNPKHMKYFNPTPNKCLRQKLGERFEVFEIDEYRTSCLHHKTEKRCDNAYRLDRKGRYHKIHAVLTYKMENGRYGCINRDRNAVWNMKKIVDHHLECGDRPLRYRRNYDLPENPESATHNMVICVSNALKLLSSRK